MGIADDVISRADALSSDRALWEREWREVADYFLPTTSREMMTLGMSMSMLSQPASRENSRKRFDDTAIWALDRLAAGMESLVTPQAEKWHGLGPDDAFAPDPSDAEREWFEKVRDFLFVRRYESRSGFSVSNQKAIRSACAFGTSVMFIEESWGADKAEHRLPFTYRFLPLFENYLSVNAQGDVDTNYRRYAMTARQMVQRFGERCSSDVKAAAENDTDKEKRFEVIHAVLPRQEAGGNGSMARHSRYASYYIEVGTRTMLGASGFFEFPFVVYHWLQSENAAYGESPAMLALDTVRGLNVGKKAALKTTQQWASPPLAVAHDGVMNRPNLNPEGINYGAVDANGRLRIQPILTAQNPNVFDSVLEQDRNQVREHMYTNLFQILIQNPNMTATEAMLRANEKGELLGPSGAKIQAGLSQAIERELGILDRKGAFRPGSPLVPPKVLAGRSYGVKFTSPLDRLRRMEELKGVRSTLEFAIPLMQIKPDVADMIDADAIMEIARDINGAPTRMLTTKDDREAMREQRAQMQNAAATAQLVQQGGAAATEAATGAASMAGVADMFGMTDAPAA